ncbi:FAD-dependent oxidoreductase [Niabella soli DSM 19437]|uniref:FAD-dependent oxidoreductase n=2 Tax=Niabella TaxID=379899 RepID=W0F4B4_9BACT|nr:FAD-dependent oxidoreductase [Niabella soli DSM 19437]
MKTERISLLKAATAKDVLWDVVVIGGGATGLGTALEAVTRGYKTLLLEQSDFAKGTSSRSTKLVHGGVRYLAQGNVGLVREASIERGLLLQNAPHLVKNQTFIIPVYSFTDRLKYTIGLKLYDWIAGRLSLGRSYFISRKKALEALPGINQEKLTGGVLYHDGQFDDSRLAINLAQTIIEEGGVAINYMKVLGLEKPDAKGHTVVEAEDMEQGVSYKIKTKAVVNATGVFVDAILKMEDPAAPKSVVASQGIHLVLNKTFFSSAEALMIPKTNDGRVLFAVPWHNEVVVGTTDTPVGVPSMEPRPLEKEITFILNTVGNYLVKKPCRKDVQSVFVGLRPLAAPKEGAQKTKEISRSHKIIISPTNLFTIIGGKWTTYRKMGEDMVDAIEKKLNWPLTKTRTPHLKIHGYKEGMNWEDPYYFYGSDAEGAKTASEEQRISDKLRIDKAQVVWAVQHEMARTVEDFLARRTRALFLDARESIRICQEVATIMAAALNRDDDWIQNETVQFRELAQQYLLN